MLHDRPTNRVTDKQKRRTLPLTAIRGPWTDSPGSTFQAIRAGTPCAVTCHARREPLLVQAFNQRHGRSGTLWQSGFKSCLVESERYLMAVYRYIELNPVRAAIVERPEQHRWSSIHASAGLLRDELVTPHPTFLAIDHDPIQRAVAYQTWLHESVTDDELHQIRSHIVQQRALGDTKFQAWSKKPWAVPPACARVASHRKRYPRPTRTYYLRPLLRPVGRKAARRERPWMAAALRIEEVAGRGSSTSALRACLRSGRTEL